MPRPTRQDHRSGGLGRQAVMRLIGLGCFLVFTRKKEISIRKVPVVSRQSRRAALTNPGEVLTEE